MKITDLASANDQLVKAKRIIQDRLETAGDPERLTELVIEAGKLFHSLEPSGGSFEEWLYRSAKAGLAEAVIEIDYWLGCALQEGRISLENLGYGETLAEFRKQKAYILSLL